MFEVKHYAKNHFFMFIYDNVSAFNILRSVIEIFPPIFRVSHVRHTTLHSRHKTNVLCFSLLIYIYYTSTENNRSCKRVKPGSSKQLYVSIKTAEKELTRKGFLMNLRTLLRQSLSCYAFCCSFFCLTDAVEV